MHEYQPLQINPFTDTLVGPDYEFTNIAELSTYNILKTLNARKARGPDGISNWILKDYAEILAKPVFYVAHIESRGCRPRGNMLMSYHFRSKNQLQILTNICDQSL